MLAVSRFGAAVFVVRCFESGEAGVLFAVMHGCLCLACLRFAVWCSEKIRLVRLVLNRILVKFVLEFVRYLIFDHYLFLVYLLVLDSVDSLRFLKVSYL